MSKQNENAMATKETSNRTERRKDNIVYKAQYTRINTEHYAPHQKNNHELTTCVSIN